MASGLPASQVLREAAVRLRRAGCDSPRLEAEVILSRATGRPREYFLAHPDTVIGPDRSAAFWEGVSLRERGWPLAYVTGRREFLSLELEVGPGVLIPRPETELLVEVSARVAADQSEGPLAGTPVADVGTGSGAVVVALALRLPDRSFFGSDSSPRALEYAQRNLEKHGVSNRVSLLHGDLLEALAAVSGRPFLGGVVANLPYVSDDEWAGLDAGVRDHEPPESLRGGPDGLESFRRLAAQLPRFLRRGGFACLEVGAGQAEAVRGLMADTGLFAATRTHLDLAGRERVVEVGPARD